MFKLFVTEFERAEKVHRADITFAYGKAEWDENNYILAFKNLEDAFEAYKDEVKLSQEWVSRKRDMIATCVELVELSKEDVHDEWSQKLIYQHIICKKKTGY